MGMSSPATPRTRPSGARRASAMLVVNLDKDDRYELLVSKNISLAAQFFETYRTFSQGEIHSLYWDGVGMITSW